MGIRHWLRRRLTDGEAGDVPPTGSIVDALFGREEERPRPLGAYDAESYPGELTELLLRRQEVTDELMTLDLTDPGERMEAIPRLQALLRTYPHPLAYETLIHAYMDAGRYDEAKGVAWAAKERRIECTRSPFPEIRSETDRLREWSPEDIEELRREQATHAAAPPPEGS